MERLAAAPAQRIRPAGLVAAWLLTGLALAAACGSVIAWRQPIMRGWPASSRILATFDPLPADSARVDGNKVK